MTPPAPRPVKPASLPWVAIVLWCPAGAVGAILLKNTGVLGPSSTVYSRFTGWLDATSRHDLIQLAG